MHHLDKQLHYLCRCDCGVEKVVNVLSLRTGRSKSCGCLKAELNGTHSLTHGMTDNPEYQAWQHMRRRCSDPTSDDWERYGGRGITVCERWNSFEAFYADMGPKPTPGHSIDRYPDQNGNYEKDNCRWATAKEQNRNRRDNVELTFTGRTQLLVAWAEELGIPAAVIHNRLLRGWTVERALTQPVRKAKSHGN